MVGSWGVVGCGWDAASNGATTDARRARRHLCMDSRPRGPSRRALRI